MRCSVIGLSHGGSNMFSSDQLSKTVLIGTIDGVAELTQLNGEWGVTARYLKGKHIHAILITSIYIYAGVWWGDVYKSSDHGKNWDMSGDGIEVKSIFSLSSRSSTTGERLFVGTEPAHLYYSDDCAVSWSELPAVRSVESLPNWRFAADPFEAHLKHIAFDPHDPAHIFVSIEVGGLLESFDNGATWKDINVPNPDVHRVLIDPVEPQKMKTTGGAGLLITKDGGLTWDTLLGKENDIGSYPDQFVHLPSDPDKCWIAASQTGPRTWVNDASDSGFAGGRIGQSSDGGKSWKLVTEGLPDRLHGNIEAMCVEESEGSFQLFAGMTDGEIWWSGINGSSWELIAQTAPVSKSVHTEMLTGVRTHALKFSDGQQVAQSTN